MLEEKHDNPTGKHTLNVVAVAKVIAQEPSTMKQKIDSVTKAEKPKHY